MNIITPHIRRILERARWAPSGDNTQPWRFEVLGKNHVVVHGYDTRAHVVYDLDGHASQLAVGALLETIQIAASAEGYLTSINRRPDPSETHLQFDVRFQYNMTKTPDSLSSVIEKRVVQRRPMSTRPLTENEKADLANALPNGYQLLWFEGLAERWRLSNFMFDNAKIRLIMPEAYQVHKSVIDWGAQFSDDKIPEQAVGVDRITARFMRWLMVDWRRVDFFNTWLMGHVLPRIQLDLIPGLACAAHFALLAPVPLHKVDDYLTSGRVMQRFWLTATQLGLFIQPEMTPVIFTRYYRRGLQFTESAKTLTLVRELNRRLMNILVDRDIESLFFIGRLGSSPAPRARSTRLPLDQLIVDQSI